VAEGDFDSVDAVDSGIAGGGAAEGGDFSVGDEAHVHEVVLNRIGQIESDEDACFADMQFAEHAHLPDSIGLPEGQDPETTTGLVGIQYTTESV
jgi:hypothetical protein